MKNGAGDGRFRESVLLSFVSFTFAADGLTVIFAGDALSGEEGLPRRRGLHKP